jgi:hypothetical protein
LLGESRGNPLALVEVARELTPEQLTGDAVLPDPLPATGSLRQLFARRLRQLTPEAQLLLAVAALWIIPHRAAVGTGGLGTPSTRVAFDPCRGRQR